MCASLRPSMAYEIFGMAYPAPTPKLLSKLFKFRQSLAASVKASTLLALSASSTRNPSDKQKGAVGGRLLKMCGAMDGGAEASHGRAEGAVFRSLPPTAPCSQPEARKARTPKSIAFSSLTPSFRTYTSEAQGEPPSPDELHQGHRPIAKPEHRQRAQSAGSPHR